MKLVRYRAQGATHRGSLQADGSVVRLDSNGETEIREIPDALLAPIEPRAVIGIGLNYREHAKETNAKIPDFPVVFFKNPGSVCGPNEPILLPQILKSTKVDFEGELGVVIERDMRNATPENALDFVLGYTIGNDISARDWQKDWGGSQWCRGKSFDGFCPLGPAIVTTEEIPDPQALEIVTTVSGEPRQKSSTADMIFSVKDILVFLSADTTILEGTVILTGTPSGVGAASNPTRFLHDGDRVDITIAGIGTLSNPVKG